MHMKITVVAVGKLKERFWSDACAEYAKRLGGYATVRAVSYTHLDVYKRQIEVRVLIGP